LILDGRVYCLVSASCSVYSCLMDFKGHNIDVRITHSWEWLCTRSTAVKFGIPFGPVLKHGPRSLSIARVNGYMKPIGRKNLTVMGLRVVKSSSIPGYFHQHMQQCMWKIYHERSGYDPKDGELCLIRLKSGETLMEDRSNSDVQIDCQNWA
jgi:hypothetical protein